MTINQTEPVHDITSLRWQSHQRGMRRTLLVACFLLLASGSTGQPAIAATHELAFDSCWLFHLGSASGAYYEDFDDSQWQRVRLPHTARIENLVTGATGEDSLQWQGICWYRKEFQIERDISDKVVWLKFEAAMGTADVWLNGQLLTSHQGGYLPIVLDISGKVRNDAANVLAVRLNNHDNGITGPKPLAHLDYNFYGGLYRQAALIIKDRLHITDPILADKPSSGGVFVTCQSADQHQAKLQIQTHVANVNDTSVQFAVCTTVIDSAGKPVAEQTSEPQPIAPNSDATTVQTLEIANPNLWSPASPYLYTVRTELLSADKASDTQETRIGVRRMEITQEGLRLNGQQLFLRGTNRHQEYPFIGYALSNNAQYRDARKIKEAGFDYVRLSHYPHAPAFLDACDELGLMVMNCVLGWQYYSELDEFQAFQFRQARQLIRRDRNHPSVLLWEVSLNESAMTLEFSEAMHQIAHEEYPGDQCYTCGWNRAYDVQIQARQHGGCREITNRPCVVSEYGDWEYYAHNAGLAQDKWENLTPSERNSRQDRTDGENRLLQQATNFQEAYNDNRKTTAFADGLWVMFDYNRGYSPDLETSGCMDIFRLAKPSYYFFQSQREADTGAVVHIANRWTQQSPLQVRVFCNCDQVALYLNGNLVASQKPDSGRLSTHLAHPPFTFKLDRFVPGTLKAVGLIDGKVVQTHQVHTPAAPEQLVVSVDHSGRSVTANENDVVFVHARVVDEQGVLISDDSRPVTFDLQGSGELIGINPAPARAGIATVLYRGGSEPGQVKISATATGIHDGEINLSLVESPSSGEEACEQTPRELARSR